MENQHRSHAQNDLINVHEFYKPKEGQKSYLHKYGLAYKNKAQPKKQQNLLPKSLGLGNLH